MYDQQREAYVQSVLTRAQDLEQQLAQAKQTKQEAGSDGEKHTVLGKDNWTGILQCDLNTYILFIAASTNPADPEKDAQLKSQYEQMQKDLKSQSDQVTRGQQELNTQREQVNVQGSCTSWTFMSNPEVSLLNYVPIPLH